MAQSGEGAERDAQAEEDEHGEEVEAEMDAVQSMFSEDIQDIVLEGPARRWLRVAIRPDVAGEGSHVHASLSLTVELPAGYPATARAHVKVENVVGLSDADVEHLDGELKSSSEELLLDACPSVFQLLEVARAFVNARNTPSDDCCVCLCEFEEDEAFTKTRCAHCFHSECLARWIHDQRVQVGQRAARDAAAAPHLEAKGERAASRCPICRSELEDEAVEALGKWLAPLQEDHDRSEAEACAREAEEAEARERAENARRKTARQEQYERERAAFVSQAIVVVEGYAESMKVLRHSMGSLGATECRIIAAQTLQSAGRNVQGDRAVVWFGRDSTAMERAVKAVKMLQARNHSRIATLDDLRAIPGFKLSLDA